MRGSVSGCARDLEESTWYHLNLVSPFSRRSSRFPGHGQAILGNDISPVPGDSEIKIPLMILPHQSPVGENIGFENTTVRIEHFKTIGKRLVYFQG
jgi:hypothetical protein